ncbi:MAG: hypothetical protein ACK4NA_14955 [Alphaproteobacteria bacterium]
MEDKDYLAALRRALDDGRMVIELDYAKLDHVDSPALVQAEKGWWVFGGLFGSLAAGWFADWHYGVGFAAIVAALYVTLGRRLINRRMRIRMRAQVMEDVVLWRKQWRLKGVTLVSGGERCASPDGNWIRFAIAHAAEGMSEAPPQA